MILNNYWRYAYSVENNYFRIGEGNFNINTGCRSIDGMGGVEIIGGRAGNAYWLGDNFALRSNLSAVVGSGSTEPTPEDFSLSQPFSSGVITNLQSSVVTSSTDDSYKTIISISGKNSADSPITIREVGITKRIRGDGSAETFNYEVMFIRHILEEPIEVSAGGNFAFVFEWDES